MSDDGLKRLYRHVQDGVERTHVTATATREEHARIRDLEARVKELEALLGIFLYCIRSALGDSDA